jgi:hypothetical protein
LFDAFKLGIYILLFIPGFIFVQTKDYHLLREKKAQFEKALEIILWSAFLWVLAGLILIWFLGNCSTEICKGIQIIISKENIDFLSAENVKKVSWLAGFFLSVCVFSFIFATCWGIFRKYPRIDRWIKWFTGRDWYASVAFKFFHMNMNKGIEVTVKDTKYIGVLFSAPDTKEDKHIIVAKPKVVIKTGKDYTIEELPLVDYIAIKFDKIDHIKAFSEKIIKAEKKEGQK